MRFFFLLFLVPFYLLAEWDSLFPLDEDPALFHHVHVISGQLCLAVEDTVLQGAYPLSLSRTYSSSGALQRGQIHKNVRAEDLKRDCLTRGAWQILPHTKLLVIFKDPSKIEKQKFSQIEFHAVEPNGATLAYKYIRKESLGNHAYYYYYQPEKKVGIYSGTLSAKSNPQNNILRLYVNKKSPGDFDLSIFPPGGGERHYEKLSKQFDLEFSGRCYYRLAWESLSSGHKLVYTYVKDQLHLLDIKNPGCTKTLSWIHFDLLKKDSPYRFKALTSDNNSILYAAQELDGLQYLREVLNNSQKSEVCSYSLGTKGQGYRLSEMVMDGQMQVKVHYYGSSKPLYQRDEKFYRKYPCVDKVQKLEAPIGPNGDMQTLAEFSYAEGRTDVRDAEGVLTRYQYHEDQITQIEYFTKQGGRHSILRFIWMDKRLKGKVLCDAENRPVFSKTFFYDDKGNVVEEVLWGQITGQATGAFGLNADGSLSGADCIKKWYHYDSWCNITEEVEDGGMSYKYSYKEGTDLPTRKLSFHEGKILKREFFCYNEDHLLVEEIVDDGTEYDLNNLSCVHQRIIKRYERDEQGFIKAATHYYHSDSSHSECLIERHVYEYDCHHLLSKDIVYDAHGNYRYTLETEYDDRGHVTSQSTALGMKNLYRYNPQGRLIESKEVGEPQKIYTYDPMGRVLCCEELDDENHSKISYNNYDSKGRITSQVDFLGRSTYQNYDAFGRCIRTEFPEVKDESEHVYTPCVDFTYDVCGNLSSHTNPRGEITQTEYNVFQKPTRITRADGTEVYHTYYKNGMLAKTIEPDRTEIHYAYDPFLRMTSKKVYSAQGELLSEASWIYGTFQLLSHTDEKGLTTTFSYDGSGKKIAEVASSEAGSRVTFFSYDSLGFLQRATSGDSSQVEIHDEEGHILEKWEEKGSYKENHTKFFYDDKGLLREARRITSQGEACDLFSYNSEGRLCRHEDPLHAITQFLYHPVRNDLGQLVLCKLSINALGVKTIETDDATNRLISREKQDERGNTLSLEEYFYDRAGNRSKKICTVYLNANPLKKVIYLSEYDSMGRVVKEIEAGKKITSYSYDEKGRVKTKLLPSGVCLEYRYDGLGRILSMTSSDQSVQYLYTYETNHGYKMRVDDLMNGRTFQRFYNSFGEMIEEASPLWNLSWDYDASGRNTCFTLPDSSSITREYFDGHLFTVTRRNAQGSSLYAHTYLKTDPNGHVEEERLIYDLAEVQTKHDLLERLYLQTSPWNAHQVGYDVLGRVEHIDHSLLQEKKISYDQLDQLQQEGDQTYLFDSMGNSSSYETNDCNEVLSTPDSTFSYDLNGNLIKRSLPDQTIFYSYDALGRLTSITYPRSKKITYAYDPFSRLFSREIYLWKEGGFQKDTLHFFLHDHEKEIGALNEHKELVQLKVLGLGLRGDIGAAVAIELDHEVYAPLHDYRGSCIALISSAGSIVETYQIAAFGKEQTHPASPKNPWRFSSKRQEEGLVFFGLRCYDITLERWLTPDPAGHVDGPNLYAYVLNSPLNRLDLFGLVSDQWGREHSSIFSSSPQYPTPTLASLSIAQIREAQLGQRRLLNIFEKGAKTNWFVICEHTHKLQFSAQELEIGSVKLFDHFAELYPKDGKAVGLITVQNGIYTPSQPFQQMCLSVTDKVPEGTLLLGMHNASGTMTRTFMEKLGFPSQVIRATSQMMGAIAENLYKINPDSIWLDIRHSEGGLIGRRSIDRLTQDQKNILLKQYICLAFAPAEMMPNEYGLEVTNIFSEKDRVTGWAAQKKDKFTYDVKILECASSGSALTLWLTEHYFMGPTYQKGVDDALKDIRNNIGFYDGNTR